MNILVLSSQPYPYGMAGTKRIRYFLEVLAEGNRVNVVVYNNKSELTQRRGSFNGVNWEVVYYTFSHKIRIISKIRKLLVKYLHPSERNILYIYGSPSLSNIMFILMAKKTGFHVICDIVEDTSISDQKMSIKQLIRFKVDGLLIRPVLRETVDGIVVISTRLENKFKLLVKNTIPVQLIGISAKSIKETEFPDNDKFTFVYSGSFGKKDAIELLLKSFSKFHNLNKNTRLVLAGKINEETRNYIKDLQGIDYVGRVNEKDYNSFLASGNVLVALREGTLYANTGFPFKLGEYLATGRPVLASRISDIENYLMDKRDALLVSPDNEQELIRIFQYCVDNSNALHSIGMNGREVARKEFNIENNAAKLETLMLKIVNA